MKLLNITLSCMLLLLSFSCSKDSPTSPDILQEIENGDWSRLIINQEWSANYIINHETGTVYEGYFIFHFQDDGYFFIDAYDYNGNEIDYPIWGGQYTYIPGSSYISVDFRTVGQGNPNWPRTDCWEILRTESKLDDMPNPYKVAILSNNSRLVSDLFWGNILKFKNIKK